MTQIGEVRPVLSAEDRERILRHRGDPAFGSRLNQTGDRTERNAQTNHLRPTQELHIVYKSQKLVPA